MSLNTKKYPEDYRDVFVRVDGYRAKFIDIGIKIQIKVIARTE